MFLLLQFMTMPPILLSVPCCLFLQYPGYRDEHCQARLCADTLYQLYSSLWVQEVQAQTQELLAGWGQMSLASARREGGVMPAQLTVGFYPNWTKT